MQTMDANMHKKVGQLYIGYKLLIWLWATEIVG